MFTHAFALSSITLIVDSILSGKVYPKVLITFWKLILEADKFISYIPTAQAINFSEQVLRIFSSSFNVGCCYGILFQSLSGLHLRSNKLQ